MLLAAALLCAAALAGPHADALRAVQAGRLPAPRAARPPPPPPPTHGPDATVYGYWPYWGDDLDTIAWDQLSHLAIFGVELAADGSLTGTSRWTDVAEQAVAYGQRYDVRIHLCLIAFDDGVHAAVLPSQTRRARLVSDLAAQVDAYGADGVNLDVEGMSSAYKQDLVTLTRELRAEVGEVYLATPIVDWLGAYDYDELSAVSDGLFIMTYGVHWGGGNPGPLSPLRGGSPWGETSIAWAIDDYRSYGATDDRIVVGLPLYGDDWPTTDNSVPGTATGDGDSVTWVEALAQAEVTGRHWDEVTSTPYTFPSATHQLWYDDFYSIEEKVSWSVEQGLQGVGFWALTYEDGDARLWDRVQSLTTFPRDTGGHPDTPDGSDSPPASRGRDLGGGCGCASPGRRAGGLLTALLLALVPLRRRAAQGQGMRPLLLVLAACSPPNVRIPGDSEPGDSEPGDSHPAADGPCEPTAELETPFYTEGDEIAFSFDCTSGARRSDLLAELVQVPAEAEFDASDWTFRWTPRFDQGARYDVMLVVRPRGEPEAFPETAVATFWVADAIGDSRNQPVDARTYTEEWGLPVFHLEPRGSLGESDIPATFTVYGHVYEGEMKVRGAVSVGYPKQSYTLTFSGEDLDADRWGMGNKDHLYVISPFDDNSYTRQWLAYETWAAIAEHWGEPRLTPRTFFAVVYVSGAYRGLYLMCDRPDDHFSQEMGFSRDVNVYKSYNHDANFYRTNSSGYTKSTLHDGYDKKEGADPVDWSDLDALVAFSADHDHDAFWAAAGDWIDVHGFMDWFLFVHWTVAEDSAGKNAYLFNDPAAPLFRFCPWDFNHAFGQGWYTYRVAATTYDDFIGTNGIFAHFQAQGEAAAELWERMGALQQDGPLRETWLDGRLDEAYALIDRSATRDWTFWGPTFSSYWGSSNPNDYEQEKAYLYRWIEDREDYMRSVHP